MSFPNASLFPTTARVNSSDHLVIGGCDTTDLVNKFGTPLYVYDEVTLRDMCRQFVSEFTRRYENTKVVYASKAFINPAIAKIINEEGLGLDVVSGGELAVAQAVNFPPKSVYFHGNNKSISELDLALEYGIGRIVVDNMQELHVLDGLSRNRGIIQDIMLRISPSVDPHTHIHTTTGILDSKFGIPIETGDAERAIHQAMDLPHVKLVGLHFHLGSPIFESEPYSIAIDTALTFSAQFIREGLKLQEFSPGGGFAIGYTRTHSPPSIGYYADAITSSVRKRSACLGIDEPRLVIEPGRAIVGRAGIALYTVGSIKDIPTVRKYVSLDGGMGDNIRPALYEARYEAVVSNRMSDAPEESVTLSGKFCESGDLLIRDISLPVLKPGDIVSIPSSGAYAPAMASNYNLNPRPAILMVKDGIAQLIRRRETYQDLMRYDLL